MKPNLCIHLFGKFNVQVGELEVSGFELRKVQELFCYLLLHRAQPQHREKLAGLLWEQTSTTQSRANLRKTLWQLQATLEEGCNLSDRPILLVDSEWIQLNPQAEVWLDVERLEQAFALVINKAGAELSQQQAEMVADATQLYQGDLLDGWYQDWCLYERERLQNIYLALLNKLMDYCEETQAYEQGLAHGAQILRYDRAREQTHRGMMRLYFLAGDRTAALRQYQRCVEILEEELAVPPTDLTLSLQEQLKRNCLDDGVTGEVYGDGQGYFSTPLAALLGHLEQYQNSLTLLEQQVRQDIEAVKEILASRHSSSHKG